MGARTNAYLGGGCRVQTLAQEHRVGDHVVVKRLTHALGEESLEMTIVRAGGGGRRHRSG